MWLTGHHPAPEVTTVISFFVITGYHATPEVTTLISHATLPREVEDFHRGGKYPKDVPLPTFFFFSCMGTKALPAANMPTGLIFTCVKIMNVFTCGEEFELYFRLLNKYYTLLLNYYILQLKYYKVLLIYNITHFSWYIQLNTSADIQYYTLGLIYNITHFSWYTILHTSAEMLHTWAEILLTSAEILHTSAKILHTSADI